MNTLAKRLVLLLNKSPIIKEWTGSELLTINFFHNSRLLHNKNNSENAIAPYRFNVENKVKEAFLEIIHIYEKEDTARKGQLDFLKSALKYMNEFGVNKDIESYKALFNVFPKGKYIPQNTLQLVHHYPKHQDMALAILKKMEENFVIPDVEFHRMILNTFGKKSLVTKTCWLMYYWMPKFSQLNPWQIPDPVPTEPMKLAQLAMEKVSKIDAQADVAVYKTKDVPGAIDDTWIVSAMSKSQQELLAVQPTDKSLSVEGPFTVWIDKYCLDYFVLKGDPIKREVIYGEYDDVSDLKIPFWERHHFKIPVTIHEQDDGTYYAICATGTSSKDSLLSWIRYLQKTNPILKKVPVTFKIKSIVRDESYIEAGENESNTNQVAENETILNN